MNRSFHWQVPQSQNQINLGLNRYLSLDLLGGDDFQIGCGEDVNVTTDDFSLEQEQFTTKNRTKAARAVEAEETGFPCQYRIAARRPLFPAEYDQPIRDCAAYLVTYLGSKGPQADVGLCDRLVDPTSGQGLEDHGETGSQLAVEQLDVNLTVSDLWGLPEDLGKIQLRGVAVACSMSEGQCSLEHDFATLLKSDTEQLQAWLSYSCKMLRYR